MWILNSNSLPSVATTGDADGVPIAIIDRGYSAAPIAIIDIKKYAVSGVITQSASIPALTDTSGTISVSATGLGYVTHVFQGGQVFTLASSETPNPGEFAYNSATGIVTIAYSPGFPLVPGINLNLIGSTRALVPTNYVPVELFSVFYGLPVVGAIQWGCSLEQHPTGSISLWADSAGITGVRVRFAKGIEFEVAGIGFYVSNYKEVLQSLAEYPAGLYQISVSLSGRYSRRRYNMPSFYKPGSVNHPSGAYQDPDCALGGSSTTAIIDPSTTTTVQRLANQVGVTFAAFGSDWSVIIPKNSPQGAYTSWVEEARKRLRQNSCYIEYCNPYSVNAIPVNSGLSFTYAIPTIEITAQGDSEHSDGKFGYAAEYPNSKLDGTFIPSPESSNNENQQKSGKPQWKKRDRKRFTLTSGNKDYTAPPDDVTSLKTVSLAWDASGPTKTHISSTTEDGMPVEKTEEIWGFAYTAYDIALLGPTGRWELNGDPLAFWQIVKKEVTQYHYDEKTGYAIGWTKTGFRMGRFKSESGGDQPDTLKIKASVSTPGISSDRYNKLIAQLDLYTFRVLPIQSKNQVLLVAFSDYYKDAKENSPYVTYKVCNRDGTSSWQQEKDPTYVPSLFVIEEMTWQNSFASTPNPDSTDSKPLPDLITGEQTVVHKKIEVTPASKNDARNLIELTLNLFDKQESDIDRFTEWNIEDSAQNAAFKDKAVKETFDEHEGKPSPATRRPPDLELQQPEPQNGDGGNMKNPADDDKFEYRLTTPGYDAYFSPVQGSVTYDTQTVTQAKLAADTDLKIRDIQESVTFNATIPFTPQLRTMHKVVLIAGGDIYQTRVSQFSNTVTIDGRSNNYPILTTDGTKITSGIDRTIPTVLIKVKLPTEPKPPDKNATTSINTPQQVAKGLSVGTLFSGVKIKSRGNF
jgi:hypothetical protein